MTLIRNFEYVHDPDSSDCLLSRPSIVQVVSLYPSELVFEILSLLLPMNLVVSPRSSEQSAHVVEDCRVSRIAANNGIGKDARRYVF